MEVVIRRFEIRFVRLDPAVGAETAKTRPYIVLSPDEANENLQTVVVAPMTTVLRQWPTRVPIRFKSKSGEIAIDQIRAVDKSRLGKRETVADASTQRLLRKALAEFFA